METLLNSKVTTILFGVDRHPAFRGMGINEKRYDRYCIYHTVGCRGDRIRTCDHLVPNQERYRAALHPERHFAISECKVINFC